MPQTSTDESLDGELDLKKRSRRRLVGAAALALLAAVVLPMVMDREPRQPAQDVQVKIPSQDGGGLASRVQPTKPTALPSPVAELEPKIQPAAKVEPNVPEAAKEVATVAPPMVDKPVVKAVEKTAEKHVDKPAEKPAQSRAENARALAALSGSTDAASGDTTEQWVVQLGAYKEAGNVKILLGKLKQMNIPAYTEDFESPQGARTRVRAGPFKSRDAAEKAKGKIRILGVDGPVAAK